VAQVSECGRGHLSGQRGGRLRRDAGTQPLCLKQRRGPLDAMSSSRSTRGGAQRTCLAVGQIYLSANPLPREPLQPKHIKPRPLGHFGSVPGLNLVCLNDAVAVGDDGRSSWKQALRDAEVAL
jgi:xylulose-5-phosphate/fructose-6-phosphate phosphoketolase